MNMTGCPCGCLTKPPYYDDPDCVRHRPLPARSRRRPVVLHEGHDPRKCDWCDGLPVRQAAA